ncbi:hypothetical protein AURDEDRAFT_115486 [Auricularia subglabra TFB-10046 SS5]|uniref:Uncharacterized protein n=1 Tax=Auricularia subglabra (strain TFB-10046 / SS5) TaxID=717982 RepID=J0D2S8_AURST|nr:hypothetical protein AURDEDRAFT_115486 [Auricularia subglabra TFB-10046 SS5]
MRRLLSPQSTLAVVCLVASAAQVFIARGLLTRPAKPRYAPRHGNHSYVGDDHPLYLIAPDDMPKVALAIEESVHWELGDAGLEQWELYVKEHSWYKLGPNYHGFVVTMYHDIHCLRVLHRALFPVIAPQHAAGGHAQHCLNYLRQMALCRPDLTLEPPDVLARQWDVDRSRSTHLCHDWSLAQRRGDEAQAAWLSAFGGALATSRA